MLFLGFSSGYQHDDSSTRYLMIVMNNLSQFQKTCLHRAFVVVRKKSSTIADKAHA